MSDGKRNKSSKRPTPPEPVNVIDGVPDRSEKRGKWKIVVILAVFAAWVAFLVYCKVAGSPQQ
jgi:hypothetical protein